ncbi:MAG: L-seryl-tRNA(Sec) selenium transferase [Candidatus Marinimicrobia bacterium]|nr:L-seryl-tRNA(Sec) selenium transferase [Candidatus Neomarinimicrobiota bacterium]
MTLKNNTQKLLKSLPSVDKILAQIELDGLKLPHELILFELREELESERKKILSGDGASDISKEKLTEIIAENTSLKLKKDYLPSLKKVINATGIVLHTNLGRAPLSEAAIKRIGEVAGGYSNLEIDVETGKRSDRTEHISRLLVSLTGGESAALVNNNAAAVLLTLNTFAYKKECIVSRGQLVEIGGSFRMPDVMERAGTKMVEIGTTNRTHLKDFENALNDDTGAVILVHTSNYTISGFTNFPEHSEIVDLAHKRKVPVIYDLGSGTVADLTKFGLPPEELVSAVLKSGVDVVTFSGDKLLGGPQAGLLVGSAEMIEMCKQNPMMRVLRCDKLTLTAMEETLKLFADEESLSKRHKLYSLFSVPIDELKSRAERTIKAAAGLIEGGFTLTLRETTGEAGSGSLPEAELESIAIEIRSERQSVDEIARKFRSLEIPIIGYIRDNAFFLDLRAVFEDEIDILADSIGEALKVK